MCEVRDVIIIVIFTETCMLFFVERFIYLNTAFS